MTEKLKPCPFCGGEPRRVDLDDIDETDSNFGGSLIECTQCGACSPVHFEFKENLLDSWNTRATGWRPIEEAPKDGTEVLLYFGDMDTVSYSKVVIARWVRGADRWVHQNRAAFSYTYMPTHFMLITPPDSEAPATQPTTPASHEGQS